MQGIILLVLSFLTTFLLSTFTNLKPLTNYNNKFEYVPILTSNILADLLIIYIKNLINLNIIYSILYLPVYINIHILYILYSYITYLVNYRYPIWYCIYCIMI